MSTKFSIDTRALSFLRVRLHTVRGFHPSPKRHSGAQLWAPECPNVKKFKRVG